MQDENAQTYKPMIAKNNLKKIFNFNIMLYRAR